MVLLEREAPLRDMSSALDGARNGTGQALLISGEAGIGKTALVDHFSRMAPAGLRIWWGACDALFTPRPLGPLHDMAPQMSGRIPTLLDAAGPRSILFSTVLVELQNQPTIVVVEDIHWADEATFDLLRYLGRRIASTRALLVITFRDDELGPTHPLHALLRDLEPAPDIHPIGLRPLSEAAVRVLVGSRPLDSTALYQKTRGNPYFVTEVIENLAAGLPATVRDAVLARAARLSVPARRGLEAAAVLGPRIEPWALDICAGAGPDIAEEWLHVGMLIGHGEAYVFRNELARQIVLDATPPGRRQNLHRRGLEALRTHPVTRTDRTRLTHLAAGADDPEAILEFAPGAARQAAQAGAHREAAALYRLALESADEATPMERALWLEACADELHTIGRLDESAEMRGRAITTWEQVGNASRQGRNLARLAVTLINTGRPQQAWDASQASLELLQPLPPGPDLALAQRTRGHLLMLNRECEEAIVWSKRSAALARRVGADDILARAYTTLGAAWMVLDHARGRHYLERCVSLAESTGWEFGVANAYANLGSISCETVHLSSAETYLRAGLSYVRDRDQEFLLQYLTAWLALTLVFRGDWHHAREAAAKALQDPAAPTIGRLVALVAEGRIRVRRGEANAWGPLDAALALAEQSQTVQRVCLARTARAEAAWLTGDHQRAAAEARAGYALVDGKRHPWFVGELGYWLWRAGEAVVLPEWAARPYLLHTRGDWRGAAAAWAALGCPYERARSLADGDHDASLNALQVFDDLGARSAAAALRERLRREGARVPQGPRATTRRNPYRLTQRQAEILNLLALGYTNAEIAAQLHLRPKTVENHVTALLAKLGVRTRREAADIVRDPQFRLSPTSKK